MSKIFVFLRCAICFLVCLLWSSKNKISWVPKTKISTCKREKNRGCKIIQNLLLSRSSSSYVLWSNVGIITFHHRITVELACLQGGLGNHLRTKISRCRTKPKATVMGRELCGRTVGANGTQPARPARDILASYPLVRRNCSLLALCSCSDEITTTRCSLSTAMGPDWATWWARITKHDWKPLQYTKWVQCTMSYN